LFGKNDDLEALLDEQMTKFAIMRTKTKDTVLIWECNGTRASGDANTSTDNTELNLMAQLWALGK